MVKARKILSKSIEHMPLSKTIKTTIASLHLENITLSPESVADLQLVEGDKLSQKEAITRVLARVSK